MRIEKINDNQIRCTLSYDDLRLRHLNISELAYGSDNARSLFREMLTKASKELGFHVDNVPLMVEAVPLAEDSVMLLITKVEEPDEIDVRFSKFSPSDMEDFSFHEEIDNFNYDDDDEPVGADSLLDEFSKQYQNVLDDSKTKELSDDPSDFCQIFSFSSIDDICKAAKIIKRFYKESNSLYKDPDTRRYYLVVTKGKLSVENFNRCCNLLCEYGEYRHANPGTAAYYEEHFELILAEHALQSLAKL